MSKEATFTKFSEWLGRRCIVAARGDELDELDNRPEGRFWLGRLAPEDRTMRSVLGDRGERMDPCAVGIRLRPAADSATLKITAAACLWVPIDGGRWRKSERATDMVEVALPFAGEPASIAFDDLALTLGAAAGRGVSVRADIEVSGAAGRRELTVLLVNDTPDHREAAARPGTERFDSCLYEVSLRVEGLPTRPYLLESLPDSFRYDRRIAAYGVNCSVEERHGGFESRDYAVVKRKRPAYWSSGAPQPDLSFSTLSDEPLGQLDTLVAAHRFWGEHHWGAAELDRRAAEETWDDRMREEAEQGRAEFDQEGARLAAGVDLLRRDDRVLRAFRLMNRAMAIASRGKYPGWRPFQVGFMLANLTCVTGRGDDADVVDILWFATGGGKTETYLGLVLATMFHDRMRGKTEGMTAWSRFPLRLLSLQQTQRFANAVAAAELVRREEGLGGDAFSLGFFVGDSSTPNQIKDDPRDGEPDSTDPQMPHRYKVLQYCPFCGGEVEMDFDRSRWTLDHRCRSDACPWTGGALPVHVVDYEIYRFLPTVVVGTLDKVASAAIQAAMSGMLRAPFGICPRAGHGYTYASRSGSRRHGCLVPGCREGRADSPSMNESLFAPSIRLQDELHLLRDSLGAIDAHYESLLDHLQQDINAAPAKVLASSATLAGYAEQCAAVYDRNGRVFPALGPRATESFWTTETNRRLRSFVSLAPRGVTIEFAADRLLTTLFECVCHLADDPAAVCGEAGVPAEHADELLSLYGTAVAYANTLRDLEAASRSLETQVEIGGKRPHTASLTGNTPFSEVAETLDRLESPEADFVDRVHVVTASSMMSHGVDIDRLNVMTMLGVPLTTAEFIQTTARIGRTHPGLVFVLHKMSLERDASVYRNFDSFVTQGDRFVEPVPVTRRSLNVLERTLPGLMQARIHHVHEPRAGGPLSMARHVRDYANGGGMDAESETRALIELLNLDEHREPDAVQFLAEWVEGVFDNVRHFPPDTKWVSDLFPGEGPMRSLRDVETQAPIYDRGR